MLELKIKTPNNQELRSFALTISVALGIVGALVLWRRGPMGFIFIAIGAVVLLAGLVLPKSLVKYLRQSRRLENVNRSKRIIYSPSEDGLSVVGLSSSGNNSIWSR